MSDLLNSINPKSYIFGRRENGQSFIHRFYKSYKEQKLLWRAEVILLSNIYFIVSLMKWNSGILVFVYSFFTIFHFIDSSYLPLWRKWGFLATVNYSTITSILFVSQQICFFILSSLLIFKEYRRFLLFVVNYIFLVRVLSFYIHDCETKHFWTKKEMLIDFLVLFALTISSFCTPV